MMGCVLFLQNLRGKNISRIRRPRYRLSGNNIMRYNHTPHADNMNRTYLISDSEGKNMLYCTEA